MCSKHVIEGCIKTYIAYVQSDIDNVHFMPGEQWWLLDEPAKLSKRMANTLTFLEQIGVTKVEIEAAFGSRWKAYLEKNIPELRIRSYFGNVAFVTPSDGIDFDGSQTPHEGSIVTKAPLSLNNRNWERLQAAIVRRHPPLPSSPPEVNIIIEPLNNNTRSTCSGESDNSVNAFVSPPPALQDNKPFLSVLEDSETRMGTSTNCVSPSDDSAALVRQKMDQLVPLLTQLRQDKVALSDVSIKRSAQFLANECIHLKEGSCKILVVQSAKGSIPQTWVQIQKERGGSSMRMTQRVSKGAAGKMIMTTIGRPSFISQGTG